ncbi:MAG: DUF2071 domain-containing protein [Cytophagales bacterium]|nr:DUF2071 domain-containing protein [Cytophagales bacterium]
MSFLKTEWRKLALANFVVPPECLKPYLPSGTELDYWEDKCYLSLVGLRCQNTKVLGVKVPFHAHFEEVKLQFYVKNKDGEKWKKGVAFIKEIVPKRAISLVANAMYKEHYETMPMRYLWEESDDSRKVAYSWKKSDWHSFEVQASLNAIDMLKGSDTEFFTEHYWGITSVDKQTSVTYEVIRPRWVYYPVFGYDVKVDFGELIGEEFSFLNEQLPESVMLAEGSMVKVESKIALQN